MINVVNVIFLVKLHMNKTAFMNLFLNEIPIFLRPEALPHYPFAFDIVLSGDQCRQALLHRGRLMLEDPPVAVAAQLLQQLASEYNPFIYHLEIITAQYEQIFKVFSSPFLYMEAAGGIVYGKACDAFLIIKRLGKWDLPKGKIELNETPEQTAQREVFEESRISAQLQRFVCDTYHTYKMGSKPVLKRTYWFLLDAEACLPPQPQTEESIEDARWVPRQEISRYYQPTYSSIRFVWENVLQQSIYPSNNNA